MTQDSQHHDEDGEGAEEENPPDFYAEGLPLIEGGTTFTIPSRFRDLYDIEEGDIIDLYVYTPDHTFLAADCRVGVDHRVTIPQRKRKLYGIEDLDHIAVDVQLTGMTLEA